MAKVAILTVIPTPYRIPFFAALAKECELLVLFDQRSEKNRSWQLSDNLGFPHKYSWGITYKLTRRRSDGTAEDVRFLQLRLGMLLDLFRFRPDVVITGEFGLKSLMALCYCKLLKRPMVLWSEGTPHSEGWVTNRLKLFVRRLLVRQARRYWVNGEESEALIKRYGGQVSQCDRGMTGVDTQYYLDAVQSRRPHRISLRNKYQLKGTVLLFVGQLISRKGIEPYLEALRKVAQTTQDFSLLFVGDGKLSGQIEYWAREHGGVRVCIAGHQQIEHMPDFYLMSDIFVLPTLDDNWSLATLEAAVTGLPQYFSQYNGAPADLKLMQVPGTVGNPLDTDKFAKDLLDMIQNGQERTSLSIVRKVSKYYSPSEQATRAIRSIRKAMA